MTVTPSLDISDDRFIDGFALSFIYSSRLYVMFNLAQIARHAFIEPLTDAEAIRCPSTSLRRHVALFIDNLGGGGVQRMALTLAGELVDRGCRTDLVVCRATGPLRRLVPGAVNIVELEAARSGLARLYALAADPASFRELLRPVLLRWKAPRDLVYLPDLVRYLKREQPCALLAATPYLNLEAVWAKRLANATRTRISVSERNNVSFRIQAKPSQRTLPPLIRRTYTMADAIVAVSTAVADDLAAVAGIPRDSITTIYNPVVTPNLRHKACESTNHPWFASGAPPVVLSAGRLATVKDFPTLVRAFARVRAVRDARLMILGEAKDAPDTAKRCAELMMLAAELGVACDVDLPGFAQNPLAYMARSAVFVLSSTWEGFPNVLVEALACGCPVVSSDCPSGPAEILDRGRYGRLVPVGDDAAMAEAILATLDAPPDPSVLRDRGALFSADRAVDHYLEILLGSDSRRDGRAGAASPGARASAANREPEPLPDRPLPSVCPVDRQSEPLGVSVPPKMRQPVRPGPSCDRVSVAVCICTCNRPAALEKLLNTLCLAQLSVPRVDQVELIIVDNSPDGRARAVYERCRERLPVPIHFAEEMQRGISFARNRAVAEAFARGAHFVAFIDDDDLPQPDWLARLVERQRETKADIVTGVWRPPRELRVPPHLSELKAFTEGNFDRPTRYGLPNCGTCNVLISRSAIELASVGDSPFRAEFAFTGGGDTDFFIRAHRAGATIVQAKESVVLRCPDGDRATLGGALRYAFRLGCSRMRLAAEHFPADRYRKMRVQSAKKMIKCVARFSPFSLARTVAAVYHITICLGELYASFGGKYGYYHRPS